MELWIKNIGATDDPLEIRWFEQLDPEFRRHVRFPEIRRPHRMRLGDLMLFHAYVKGQKVGRLCAIVRVSSDEPLRDPREPGDRWPWRLDITPLLVLPLAGRGPTLTDLGLPSGLMARQSHVAIAEDRFLAAVRAIARAALPDDLADRLQLP
jgi:hypothetical protein